MVFRSGDRPSLMGILNVTPDSFSEHGIHFATQSAIDGGQRMADEGADIVDIGGESTRPGADFVSLDEELRRVVPVVRALCEKGLAVSIDTRRAEVARQALDAGALIVNDVSALSDPEMLDVCVQAQCSICLMHMKGTPMTMQQNPAYENVIGEVLSFLLERADLAHGAGIPREQILIDPGFGFGKTPAHNLELLHSLRVFVETDFPVLIGVSRKSSIGAFAGGAPVEDRLPGTLAAQVLAQAAGVSVIRAHDVKEARQAIDVTAAILKPSLFSRRPV